jgi:hypothetical protein
LGVIEKKAVNRSIAALYEVACESPDIQSVNSLFAPVTTADELNEGIRIVRIKIDDLD